MTNDWIAEEYAKLLLKQSKLKRMKIETLEAVISQLRSEIRTDINTILHILNDPSVVDQDPQKGVAYSIHERLHHLAVHKVALQEAQNILKRIEDDE